MLKDKLIASQGIAGYFKGVVGISSGVTCVSYSVYSGVDNYVIGGPESTSPSGGFVVSLSKGGVVNWQRRVTKTGEGVIIYAVKQDLSGNVYAYADVGPSLQLIKYNSSGVLQWQRKLTSASSIDLSFLSSQWLQIDSAGNLYLLIDHGTTTREVIVVKYNSSGVLQWQKKYTRASVALTARDLSIDSSDNLYVGMGYGSLGSFSYSLRKMSPAGSEIGSVAMTNTDWSGYAGGLISIGTDVFVTTGRSSVIGAEINKLNSSLAYQSSVICPSTAYVFSALGSSSTSLVATTSDFNKYASLATAPTVSSTRLFDSSVGVNEALSSVAKDTNLIVMAGRAYLSSASRFDGVMTCLDPASDIGNYPPVSVTDVSFSQTTGSNRTDTAQTLTLSNSALTDAAGDVTDSTGTYTITLYPKS